MGLIKSSKKASLPLFNPDIYICTYDFRYGMVPPYMHVRHDDIDAWNGYSTLDHH